MALEPSPSRATTAFGRLLRFWRTEFGKSQEALAFEIESSPRHVSRLETGRVLPSEQMVRQIAARLGLGERDTASLLWSAGLTPEPASLDARSADLRWLRRSTAMMLNALDPMPSMVTDGATEIHLVNRGWMGLLGERIDPAAPDGLRHYFGFLLDAIEDDGDLGLASRCGLLLTLRLEALVRDERSLHELVDALAHTHDLPTDWAIRASEFEPVASFGVRVGVRGRRHRFFHLSQTIHPHGPSTFSAGGGLALLSLLPDDPEVDWSFLVDRDRDHPRLAAHEVSRRS